MALPNDPRKKKPEDMAGVPAPQGARIGNLTLLPGSGADTAAKAIGGFFGGLKAKQDTFAQNLAENAKQQQDMLAARAPAAPLPIASAQAAPVVKPPSMTLFDASNPSNFNVRPPSANVTPARNPASSATSAGATAPAGGVPAPLKPGDANTFTGSDGVTRAVPLAATPAAGSVQAQSFGGPVGGLPLPQNTGIGTAAPAASPAPTVTPTLGVPRPAQASIGQVGAYGVQNADAGTGKIASTLEDAAFRAGLRASRGSRSAADSQAQILGTLAQLGGQRLGVAAGLAGGDRDATAGLDRQLIGETGANQRTALQDTGETTRAGLDAATRERVAQIGAQADLQRPTTVTDANGNLISVVGSTGKPVTGPDGKPVKPAQTKNDAAVTQLQAVQKSLTDQLQAEMSAPVPDAARVAMLREQLDRANASLGGGVQAPSGPPAAAIQMLKADPKLAAAFDQKYGKGAAARYIK